MSVEVLTKILAILTLLGNAFTVLLLLARIAYVPLYKQVMGLLGKYALVFAFLVAFGATFGSYGYAAVTGYPACILCWMQRIFMYPLPFILLMAYWRKDYQVLPYVAMLALVGGSISLYNWIKDMLALYTHYSLACPVVVGLPSCDHIYVDEYGYITIAMLALNAFLLIIIITYAGLRHRSSTSS